MYGWRLQWRRSKRGGGEGWGVARAGRSLRPGSVGCACYLDLVAHQPDPNSSRTKGIIKPGVSIPDRAHYIIISPVVSRVEDDWCEFGHSHVAVTERGLEVLVGHAFRCRTLHVGKAKRRGLVYGFPPSPPARHKGGFFLSVRGNSQLCILVRAKSAVTKAAAAAAAAARSHKIVQ